MADRRVRQTGKDRDGDITAMCGDWGRVSKSTAISEIDATPPKHTYFVQDGQGRRANVHVANGSTGKYLRTDPNSSCSDNLQSLPSC